MVTKAERAKDRIAEETFKIRRRWIEGLFPTGVSQPDGTLIISRYVADQLREELRQEYDDQTDKARIGHETDADRIILAIDQE